MRVSPWGVLVVALACLGVANAQSTSPAPPRIVVIGVPGAQRQQNQLVEDLRSRGFEVVETDIGPGDEHERASSSTYRLHASGMLRLRGTGNLIEVWVANEPGGAAQLREVVAPFEATDASRNDAVVRAVELLRASLIEIRRAQTPVALPSSSTRSPEPAASPTPAPPRFLHSQSKMQLDQTDFDSAPAQPPELP